ncbi:hypothetical protein [Pseudomonas sp. xss_2]|uniref:DUF7740 domain-containing protein n=1 Tax=Pseudomonas sp. xss_2 TaxID=3367215 RepID=UPI00370B5A7B
MDIVHATLCVALAARIHKTDAAVKSTAKRCAKKLSRLDRQIMFMIMNSKSPLATVEGCIIRLDMDVLALADD